MSIAPQVNFYDMTESSDGSPRDLHLEDEIWELGEIKAGETSGELSLRLWNNRSGDAKELSETFVIDINGENQLDLQGELATEDKDTNPLGHSVYFIDVDVDGNETPTELEEGIDYNLININSTIELIGDYSSPTADDEFEVNYTTYDDIEAAHMQDVILFGLDSSQTRADEIITDGAVFAKCDTFDDILDDTNGSTHHLGGDLDIDIGAEGIQVEGEEDKYLIHGTINDGTDTADENFADTTLKVDIEPNAPHGDHTFFVAVRYFYT